MVPAVNSPQNRPSRRTLQPIAAAVPKTTVVITSIQADGTETTQNVETDAAIHIQVQYDLTAGLPLGLEKSGKITQNIGEAREFHTIVIYYFCDI